MLIVNGPLYYANSTYPLDLSTYYIDAKQYRDLAAGTYSIQAYLIIPDPDMNADHYTTIGFAQDTLVVAGDDGI